MKPEIVFCNLASAKYQAELASLRSLILAPLTLWQTTKSKILSMERITYLATKETVDKIEAELIDLLKIDDLYHSSSGRRLCLILFASKNILGCILNLPQFGLSNLSSSIKTQILNDFAVCEQYVCNLEFKKILDGYANQAVQDFMDTLEDLKEDLIAATQIETLLTTYTALLTSTTKTLTGCNTDTYTVLSYFQYVNDLAKEANQLCGEAGIHIDNSEVTALGKKLSIYEDAVGAWSYSKDSDISAFQIKVDELTARIDALILRASAGVNSEKNRIPKDDLMK